MMGFLNEFIFKQQCLSMMLITQLYRCDGFAPRSTLPLSVRPDQIGSFSMERRPTMVYGSSFSDDERDDGSYELSRRDALMSSAALATSLFLIPSVSSAEDVAMEGEKVASTTSTLTDLNLGSAEWTPVKDVQIDIKSYPLNRNIIPPNFATYASRFLINYDSGVRSWWESAEQRYSLLPSSEVRKKLGNDFGSLSRSIQVSLGNFVVDGQNADMKILQKRGAENDARVQQRFEVLFSTFLESYGEKDEDVKRQLGLLFSILPAKYQPTKGLLEIFPNNKNVGKNQPGKVSLAYTENLTKLLPEKFMPIYVESNNSFRIQPAVAMYEVGIADEFGQSAVSTLFGPLSSKPLKRDKPEQSLAIYSLLGLSGALGCSLTHSLVIPVDVVKTRLQSDPDRYSNIIDGAMNIAQTEGIKGFALGAQATIAGYFWYGLSVYPTYAFSKWYLTNVALDSAVAMANPDGIALIAGAIAAIVASLGLTPLEACRIRTVSEPETYRDIGLVGTASVIANEDTSGWKALYAGLPSLLTRQIIFGSVKFLAYERACTAFFLTWPFLRDTTSTALGVTLAAGALSGALSSVVSQPADSVLTYVANNKGSKGGMGVIEGCQVMVENEGVSSLFRGLGSRCIWAAAIISGQFFLYDIFRNGLGITAEDLSETFQFVINRT